MHYIYETSLNRDPNEFRVAIEFDYFLPTKFIQWQDKTHGSIQIISIKNRLTGEHMTDLAIEEQIQLRRACWDYLENNSLLRRPNVVNIFS